LDASRADDAGFSGADVVIIAVERGVIVTAHPVDTFVEGAGNAIIAFQCRARNANSSSAYVVFCTGVIIIARPAFGGN
jgi:hypothetical protein